MSGFDRWIGKVAIVTGASSGIGAAIAERLVKEGLQVVGLARRVDKIQQLALKLSGEKGKLHALKCDVTNEPQILETFKWVSSNLGPVHIMVNNAGISEETDLLDGDTEKWRKVFDVNVIGILICTREAVKIMRANNIDGHIIHINSAAGHYDFYVPNINVYTASKHAVTNLTETCRREINERGLKIKITSVSPGLVDTEIVRINGEFAPHFADRPIMQGQDIADAVYYALSTRPHVQIHEIKLLPVGETIY